MASEFETIKKYFLPLTNNSKSAQGLKDDAAIISISSKKELIISKDLSAEDIHFKKEYGANLIAQKLLISNLSDLAASGAKPAHYLLGFSKNNNVDEKFIADFCKGLKKIGDKFKIDLIGGDSVQGSDKLCFSITIFGEVSKGKSLKRSAAKNGDLVFVSGNIGDSFLGLNLLQKKIICKNSANKKYLIDRHLLPTPRIKLGEELVKNNIKCAIDVSDGFLADLKHICESSDLEAIIWQDLIPVSNQAKSCLKENSGENKNIGLNQLFSGGEDYELIFTAPKKLQNKIQELAKKLKIKITPVGHLHKTKSKATIKLLDQKGEQIQIKRFGWEHY